MGYALFVTVDRNISGLEGWDMCGKTLARNIEKLDDVTRQLNLTPLSAMISLSED
jgi:hypothetical protein